MSEEARIRKDRDTLVVAGTGVIAFGVWNVLKAVMVTYNSQDTLLEMLGDTENKDLVMIFLWLSLAVVLLAVFGISFYVGVSARKEGIGRKPRKYRVLACLMILPHFFSALTSVTYAFNDTNDDLEMVVSALVDVMGLYVMIDLVIAAFRVKKWMKENPGKIV